MTIYRLIMQDSIEQRISESAPRQAGSCHRSAGWDGDHRSVERGSVAGFDPGVNRPTQSTASGYNLTVPSVKFYPLGSGTIPYHSINTHRTAVFLAYSWPVLSGTCPNDRDHRTDPSYQRRLKLTGRHGVHRHDGRRPPSTFCSPAFNKDVYADPGLRRGRALRRHNASPRHELDSWPSVSLRRDHRPDETIGGPVAASSVRVSRPDHLTGTQHTAKEFETDLAVSLQQQAWRASLGYRDG